MKSLLRELQVDPNEIEYLGKNLQRPECILAQRDGTLWSADARGGVVRLDPDGSQTLIAQQQSHAFENRKNDHEKFVTGTLPNGLAFAKNGDILIANFGTDRLELMKQTGETEVLYDSLNGKPIGKVNFVIRDSKDRIWITVSTLLPNWMESASSIKRDGFVALADEKGLRIVADGFAFTNEIRLDEKEEWLYIVETTGMKITRMRVLDNGDLVDRETYGPENHGAFIDGIAFDSKGNLWGTHIMTDHIFAILPDGDLTIILDDDNNSIPGKNLLEAFKEGKATPELMMECGGKIAPWMASITFGGRDLRTVYIGSLRGTNIPFFRSPISGLPLIHW